MTTLSLQEALKNLSGDEARAVWAALQQYVENGQCSDAADDPYKADPLLVSAEAVLDRMNEAVASLAEAS